MQHAYRIDGHINGRRILGTGVGTIDLDAGVSEMEVDFDRLPEGWDPRTIVLMCCDRAMVMASREEGGAVGMLRASHGHLTIGRDLVNGLRWGMMRDAAGQVMVDVRASSETDLRGDRPFDASRVEGGLSHLRRGINGIARIAPFQGVMMQAGPRLITVTTSYEAVLEDGTTLYGSTYYPHYLPEQAVALPTVQMLHVEAVDQEFDGRRLHSRTTSRVTPMVEMPTAVAETLVAAAVS